MTGPSGSHVGGYISPHQGECPKKGWEESVNRILLDIRNNSGSSKSCNNSNRNNRYKDDHKKISSFSVNTYVWVVFLCME